MVLKANLDLAARANICFKNFKFPRGNYQPIVPRQKHSIVEIIQHTIKSLFLNGKHNSHTTQHLRLKEKNVIQMTLIQQFPTIHFYSNSSHKNLP